MATARGPREVSDPSNVQARLLGGAMKSEGTPFSSKEWSAHRSQGVLLRAPGDSEGGECFGMFPITDSSDVMQPGACIKIKKMTRIYDGSTKFPKLEECAHFHYDLTELSEVNVSLNDENQENLYRVSDGESPRPFFYLRVLSNGKAWTVRRNYDNFRMFDKQLHRCIFDRKYSLLPELRKGEPREEDVQGMRRLLEEYLDRFSAIAGSMINCGPVLSWLEMDNRGNRLIVTDDSAINTPAIAAAHATKRYNAHATDEISFEVGDIISIIDMPPPDETVWWRGKRGFEVGFFPSECVEVIRDRVPPAMASHIPETPPKPGPVAPAAGTATAGGEPVLRKRGKLISFLRMFFNTRPTRTTLKRTGIVKERVFGCDLGEHLLNSGHDVPLVLKSCAEIIESHGIVDGIYRLSGVASNIQKLRVEFDEDQLPDLQSETYLQDIHSISSLLKMYFRELPNPLLTYQLYDKFAAAVQDDENRLTKLHDVVQQLPPPHYRTAEYLIRHLARVAAHGSKTGMHWKNLAIVWAPNLLRSKELETSCNVAALQGVGVQAVVTECLIMYADIIFSDKMPSFSAANHNGTPKKSRPKSLAVSTPTKLLSLEEARERALNVSSSSTSSPKQKYIDVGGGPEQLPAKYHTVIDWPHKKKSQRKGGKSPVISGWRSLFTRGRTSEWRSKQKYSLHPPSNASPLRLASTNDSALTEDDLAQRRRLRTVKSADSLLAVSLQGGGASDGASTSATVDSSYATQPGGTPCHARQPSAASAVTVHSEGCIRPLSKRSMSYDMYYSESDMEATDISPTEDGVFMMRSYTDVDSHSSHSGRSGHGAIAMETSEASYSRMADLEGRFYSHQRHQRHLSDSESIKSQGSQVHGGATYGACKSPTFRTFDSASARPARSHDSSKSPRLFRGIKSPRSLDGIRQPRAEMQATAVETDDDSYYDAVSQILGTKSSSSSAGGGAQGGPSLSSLPGSSTLTTFQPLPVPVTSAVTTHSSPPSDVTSQASEPLHVSHQQRLRSPSSSSLTEHGRSLSPVSLRKKMRSPSPCGEEPHSPLSSPPVAKSRRSRPKGPEETSSPPHSPKPPSTGLYDGRAGAQPKSPGSAPILQETHFDVNPQAKQLSPIGEMLPVILSESPGSRRKSSRPDVSPYDMLSPEEEAMVIQREGRSPLHKLPAPVHQPSGDELLRSLHLNLKSDGDTRSNSVSDYDSEALDVPPPVPPPRKRRSCEIPATPESQQHPGDLEAADHTPGELGSPQNRVSKALSVPNDLQRSRDTLDSVADMGSIGSFNELSKSLDSLLNVVATHPQRQKPPVQDAGSGGHGTSPCGDSPREQQQQHVDKDWSPVNAATPYVLTSQQQQQQQTAEQELQFTLETTPPSPSNKFPAALASDHEPTSPAVTPEDLCAESSATTTSDALQSVYNTNIQLDADVGASDDFDPLSSVAVAETYSRSHESDVVSPRLQSGRPKSPMSPQVASPVASTSPTLPGMLPVCEEPIARATGVGGLQSYHVEYSSQNVLSEGGPATHDNTLPSLPDDNIASSTTLPDCKSQQEVPLPDMPASASSRRSEWVHAPKASMEETYIDTDSPPMTRRTDLQSQDVNLEVEDEPLQDEQRDQQRPVVIASLEDVDPFPVSAAVVAGTGSQQFEQPAEVLSTLPVQQQQLQQQQHPMADVSITALHQPPYEHPHRLDRSLEDEVFTMDMDEPADSQTTQSSNPGSTKVLSCSAEEDTLLSRAPLSPTHRGGALLTDMDSADSSSPETGNAIKYMSRSYGGEHSSREQLQDSSPRARSCSGERSLVETVGRLSKTPPAVLPRKTRYEKSPSAAAGSLRNRSVPSGQQQQHQQEGTDSDESGVKYDDEKTEGRKLKKRHSPKRQKSVKELLSRFENLGGSPPTDSESAPGKSERPAVFQKPRIMHLNKLSPTQTEASSTVPPPVAAGTAAKNSTQQQDISRSPKSPRVTLHAYSKVHDKDKPAVTSQGPKSPSPVHHMSESYHSSTSEKADSADDAPPSGSEDSEGSDRKVRKLSLMFERRNSGRSDSLEPPVPLLERRKRSDSGRSESPNEPILENNRKIELPQSKLEKESNNENISKQDSKIATPRIDTSSNKENLSVRHLSQMFEMGRTSSRSPEPAETSLAHGARAPTVKGTKPWTAIV